MKKYRRVVFVLIALSVMILWGCGGGGGRDRLSTAAQEGAGRAYRHCKGGDTRHTKGDTGSGSIARTTTTFVCENLS